MPLSNARVFIPAHVRHPFLCPLLSCALSLRFSILFLCHALSLCHSLFDLCLMFSVSLAVFCLSLSPSYSLSYYLLFSCLLVLAYLFIIYIHIQRCDWLMIAFITWSHRLLPLFEGLCSSKPCRFEVPTFFGRLCWNRTDDLWIDSPALWPSEPVLHRLGCQ